jgi:hypothetical protein
MKPSCLIGFTGMALEHAERNNLKFTPDMVQRYIHDHPTSGADINLQDIKTVLDFLVQTGWLEVQNSNLEFYKRFIPTRKIKN